MAALLAATTSFTALCFCKHKLDGEIAEHEACYLSSQVEMMYIVCSANIASNSSQVALAKPMKKLKSPATDTENLTVKQQLLVYAAMIVLYLGAS